MKNTILLLVALATTISLARAQDTRGYIGISLGPSLPIGNFGSKDENNENAGLAKPGAIFDVTFAHKLGKGNFGITAMIRGQANPLDAQVLADVFANQLPGVYWTVKSDPWAAGCLLAGGFGSFPLSGKATFDVRAMIGLAAASTPEINVSGSFLGTNIWVLQNSATGASFAFLAGAGFKFALGRRLFLLANADILGMKPEFVDVETIGSDGSRSIDTWSQEMVTLNLGVGIAFRF